MRAVAVTPDRLTTVEACAALGVARASYSRFQAAARGPILQVGTGSTRQKHRREAPGRALSAAERQQVLDVLHHEDFVDLAVPQVYFQLLDQGQFLCSPRTMFRSLDACHEVRERRDQLRHPAYAKPPLLATAPNPVWSWDLTKLPGPAQWIYSYWYVVLDIFSRYAVGWMVAARQSAALARRLVDQAVTQQEIEPGQLTLHGDRGAPRIAKDLTQLLAELGITKSHSRPYVSDDNFFSEAHFKTCKYQPDFPDHFGCLPHATTWATTLFDWYHHEHRHSGIGWMTPADVHYGRAETIGSSHAAALAAAYERHPERFVRQPPTPPALPTAVWINPPHRTSAAAAQ